MTRVGRAMVRELGLKGAVTVDAETQAVPADAETNGAVSVDAETQCQLDVKGHTESSTQTEEEGNEGSKVHNATQCNIDDDENDNETALGGVPVTSNLKKRVDLNGTFGLVREYVPSKQRWGVRCAGQVLDVALAAKNLVRVTARSWAATFVTCCPTSSTTRCLLCWLS